jgi:hypothetical protein
MDNLLGSHCFYDTLKFNAIKCGPGQYNSQFASTTQMQLRMPIVQLRICNVVANNIITLYMIAVEKSLFSEID